MRDRPDPSDHLVGAATSPRTPPSGARRRSPPLALTAVNPRPLLPALVASSIKREITEKRLGPGARLPTEQTLADTFGVSRNVIREAIAELRSADLVWSRQGRGVFVSAGPSRALLAVRPSAPAPSFDELFELRTMLEPELAALAADRRTAEDLAALDREIVAMAKASYGGRRWLAADLGFHNAVFGAAHNPLVTELMGGLSKRTHDSLLAARVRPDLSRAARATLREHRAILVAIERRDGVGARRAMHRHLRAAQARLGGDVP